MNDFTFLAPEYLLLIFLPIIFYLLRPSKNTANIQTEFYFPNLRYLKQASKDSLISSKKLTIPNLSHIALFICFTLLATAAARPVQINNIEKSENNGYDLMLVLDTSLSMNALDFSENVKDLKTRLSVVKEIMSGFIEKRVYDRIGLIAFGDYPVLESPLTTDNETLGNILGNVRVAMAGNATAIGDALILAIKTILNSPKDSRAIILLTDGDNTAGSFTPLAATDIAKKHKIPIYTIGIGTNDRVPFLNLNGGLSYRQMPFNPDILKEIASNTGTKFFYAKNAKILAKVYDEINRLIKYEFKAENISYHKHYYSYFLAAALFAWLVFLLTIFTKLKRAE